MGRVLDAAANRIAPWREADWRVLIVEGAVLILAGVYLIADGERAEFILGLVVAAALLIDGIRQWLLGMRRLQRGRSRDLTLVRGAVGIVTGALVLTLSVFQQITVVGIRIAIGVGGLAYGLIGLALGIPALRSRQPNWTAAVFDVLLILVSMLLLYRVATGEFDRRPAHRDLLARHRHRHRGHGGWRRAADAADRCLGSSQWRPPPS